MTWANNLVTIFSLLLLSTAAGQRYTLSSLIFIVQRKDVSDFRNAMRKMLKIVTLQQIHNKLCKIFGCII